MKNCNDYERIRKKLEEERKKYKFCYIQGPTGPKGEKGDIGPQGDRGDRGPQGDRGLPGPASIDIGITKTVEPFEEAKEFIKFASFFVIVVKKDSCKKNEKNIKVSCEVA